jgi:hypothetical protein
MQGLDVVDHVAGLRTAIEWVEEHPAFASAITHTSIAVRAGDLELFAAMVRQLEGRRRDDVGVSFCERRFGPTKVSTSIVRQLLPLVDTGQTAPVLVREWPK